MWIVCGDVQGPPSCSYQHVLNLYFHRRAIISRTLLLYQLSTLPCLTARGDLLHSPPSLAQLLSVIQVRSSGITSVTFSRTFPATEVLFAVSSTICSIIERPIAAQPFHIQLVHLH